MIFGGLIARIGASVLFGRVKKIAEAVPKQVWIGLAVVIAVAIAVVVHQRHANAQLEASYSAGVQAEKTRLEKELADARAEAKRWREQYEQKSDALSALERTRHEEALRSNAALADALRLRGPGRAATCPGSSGAAGLSVTAGNDGAPVGQSDVEGRSVPSGDWAAVPWGWLVQRAEQCDADRDEVIRWRSWYPAQRNLYETERNNLSTKQKSDNHR